MDNRQREQLIAEIYVAMIIAKRPSGARRGDAAKSAIALADELIEQLEPSGSGPVLDGHRDRVGDEASDSV